MTQTPGEPVTRPTPTSVAAPAPVEDVHPAAEQPRRTVPSASSSRRTLAGLVSLSAGVALAATLVVRRRGTARRQRLLPLR